MINDSLAASTGLPTGKKTHRGRRSRGKGSPSTQTHLKAINASMASGDHDGAKKAALHLANALHKARKDTVKQSPLRPPAALESEGMLGSDPRGGY